MPPGRAGRDPAVCPQPRSRAHRLGFGVLVSSGALLERESYFLADGHWSAAGHAVVGKALLDQLSSLGDAGLSVPGRNQHDP